MIFENLMTARSISQYSVLPIGSRKSPPKAASGQQTANTLSYNFEMQPSRNSCLSPSILGSPCCLHTFNPNLCPNMKLCLGLRYRPSARPD